jgi:hypothetical protein
MTSTRRRPGLSLTEVLVAMFITAIGLIALFTLFPLGALQVAQALKDDRTAQCAGQADAYVRQFWRHQVIERQRAGLPVDNSVWALDDPNLLARRPDTGSTSPNRAPIPGVFEVYYAGFHNDRPLSARRQLPVGAVILPAGATGTNQEPASTVGLFVDAFPPRALNNTGEVTPAVSPPDCFYTGPGYPGYATSGYVDGRGAIRQDVPSYPMILDAVGALGRTAPERIWVAAGGGGRDLEGMQQPLTSDREKRETIFGVRQFISSTITPQPGDVVGTLIPRRKPDAFVATQGPVALSQASAIFSLTDDLTFQPNGAPNPSLLGRQGRYTWAAVLQRPHNNDTLTAKFWVLVFDGRPSRAIPTREEVVLANTFVNGGAGVGPEPRPINLINLNIPMRGPEQSSLVRRGGWIMLANLNPNPTSPARAISFHRIVGLTESDPVDLPVFPGANTQVTTVPYQLDLDPPVPPETQGNPQVYLFGGLTEVFARPNLTPDDVTAGN